MNTSETKKSKGFGKSVLRWLNDHNIIYAVVVLAIILVCLTDKFLTVNNLMNILRQTSMVAILAIGAFYTIVGGGIDLSTGAVAGLSGIMFAKMLVEWSINPVLSILLTLIFGMLVGAVNAAMIAYGGIPPFIATLGMQIAARGLCFVITNAYPVVGIPESVGMIGTGYVWFIPIPVIITIVVFLIMAFIAQKTRFGRAVYAVGSNEDASHFSGIDTKRIKAGTFVIAGLMSAIASIILTARVASGQPNGGLGWELDAITGAAIGGVSINGGKGNLLGVFIGALFVGMLTNGMTLMDLNSYYQQIVEGVVLILAIGIDVFRTSRANKV
ncbi:MAG: ABC transporter permease [Christensenellaceae bacterium]|nr:ABC transporter permease [Christensenellaceae bacterium]